MTVPVWRTSSRTGPNGNCVEVAPVRGVWLIRDTKKREGGELAVQSAVWRAFTTQLRR